MKPARNISLLATEDTRNPYHHDYAKTEKYTPAKARALSLH